MSTQQEAQPRRPPPGDFLSWAEVNRTHRIRNGVYQRGGRLISLLTDFGRINRCYPDTANDSGDRIIYTGAGRRGDQPLSPANRALLAAIESGHAVPLFNKLAPGCWQHMGFWRVIEAVHRFDQTENRMLWQFTLQLVNRQDHECNDAWRLPVKLLDVMNKPFASAKGGQCGQYR